MSATTIFTAMQYRKSLTRDEGLQKLRQFCGYQERCHQEVREKLFSLGIKKADQDEILIDLIRDNYLNEERFAISFAGGKFRIKGWGRVKIKYELKQRDISDYCIRKALKQIEENEYLATLHRVAEKKFESLLAETPLIKKKKTIEYLVNKGFERELVLRELGDRER